MRTKFHFFIIISIEFPIFDMCFPTFREICFDVVEQVISKHFSLMHTSTN